MAGGKGKIAEYNASITPAELKANQKKGGKKSGESRRAKKTARELAQTILDMALKPTEPLNDVESVDCLKQLTKENVNVKTAMILAAVKKALEGDIKAQEMLLTLAGEKIDKQELEIKSETPLSQTLIYLPDNNRG